MNSSDHSSLPSFHYSVTDSSSKYDGLLPPSKKKIYVMQITNLLNYMDSILPPFLGLHQAMSVIRAFQLFGILLCSNSNLLFPKGTVLYKFFNYCSILWNIVPIEYRDESSFYITILYGIINFSFIIFISASSYYYHKTGTISTTIVYIIHLYVSVVGYLIHAPALEICFETIGGMINGNKLHYGLVYNIFNIIFTSIGYFSYYFFFRVTYSYTFVFRPTSFQCVNGMQQMITLYVCYFQSCFIGLLRYLGVTGQIIVYSFQVLLVLSAIYTLYLKFSFVKLYHNTLFLTYITFSISWCIACVIMISLGYSMSVAGLFIWVGALLVYLIVCHLLNQKVYKNRLIFLDNLFEDQHILENTKKSDNYLYTSALIGYHFAHPASMSFIIFKHLTGKNPYSSLYWVTYGKFVSIYPELSETHNYIVRKIIHNKIKGISARQCLMTSKIIFTERETNLTYEIKNKINHVTKSVIQSKRRLRQIWDQVIQSNISEMDGSISNAYESINKVESEFNLLLTQIPNNRFLYRTYSSYLYEVANDINKYVVISDQTKLMMRGIRFQSDHTQELGFLAFPNLPRYINSTTSLAKSNDSENVSFVVEENYDDEQVGSKLEENNTISDMIEKLNFPSLKLIRVSMFALFIFTLVFSILIISLLKNYKNSLRSIEEISEATSFTRFHLTLATTIAHFNLVFNFSGFKFNYISNESEPDLQIKYSLSEALKNIQTFNEYKVKYKGNYYIDIVRELLFENNFNFTTFPKNVPSVEVVSVSDGLSKIARFMVDVAENKTLLSNEMMSSFYNIWNLTNQISFGTMNITGFIDERVNYLNNVAMGAFYLFLILSFVIFIILGVCFVYYLKNDKKNVYKTLLVLPKNVVSQISESLRSVKNQSSANTTSTGHLSNDIEHNRQEENLLKVLNTASDEDYHSHEISSIITIFVFVFILLNSLSFLLARMYISHGQIIDQNCQHVDNLMTLSSFINILFMYINDIYSTVMEHHYLITNSMKLKILDVNRVIDNISDYYTALRFGYDLGKPFPDFNELMKVAMERCQRGKMPSTYLETFDCMDSDQLIKYLSHFVHSLVDANVNVAPIFPIDNNRLDIGNLLFVYRLNDEILYRGTKTSRTSIDEMLHSSYNLYISLIVVLLIVITILYVSVFTICIKVEKKLKFTLRLLLSNAKTAIQNSFIINVLSGNFSRSNIDSSMRDNAFYDNLVDNLPDVILVSQNNKIISANKAAIDLFNDDELFDKSILELFSSFSPETEVKMKSLFDTTVKTAMVNVRNTKNNTDKQYLQITRLSHINNDNLSVFRITNNTQIYLYNKLILEERSKSDKLLSSILPSSLVPRVQSGETNISFSVPTCAVSFIDIVEFTPWCSSNSAQVVTGALNDIFSKFDVIVKELQYMERIKCIGDCYMSCCGVFSDVPNALTFARNIVDFGLRAIDAIKSINETRETNLRVRVGIHIGGPVVAGVIGVGKPTFEIFGPSISFAQQMEHSGVPMRVHVSRAIYELIYGGNYKIEERGEIQIKQGKVVTYLVDK